MTHFAIEMPLDQRLSGSDPTLMAKPVAVRTPLRVAILFMAAFVTLHVLMLQATTLPPSYLERTPEPSNITELVAAVLQANERAQTLRDEIRKEETLRLQMLRESEQRVETLRQQHDRDIKLKLRQ